MPDATPNRPVDILLVRHGESDGCVAARRLAEGDASAREELLGDGSDGLLTSTGCAQAQEVGAFINSAFPNGIDAFLTSPYPRTLQTASEMGLVGAAWRSSDQLRERNWGAGWDPEYDLFRHRDPWAYRPVGGETLAEVQGRAAGVLDNLGGEPTTQSVVLVTHSEWMWMARVEIERLDLLDWRRLGRNDDARIYPSHLLWYSRRDPVSGECGQDLRWIRRVCPARPGTDTGWVEIPIRLDRIGRAGAVESVVDLPELESRGAPATGPTVEGLARHLGG